MDGALAAACPTLWVSVRCFFLFGIGFLDNAEGGKGGDGGGGWEAGDGMTMSKRNMLVFGNGVLG